MTTTQEQDSLDQYTTPPRKLIRFFKNSRDQWKSKHQQTKAQLKKEQNQRRAVEKSRSSWKQQALDSKAQLQQLQQEFEQLQKKLS